MCRPLSSSSRLLSQTKNLSWSWNFLLKLFKLMTVLCSGHQVTNSFFQMASLSLLDKQALIRLHYLPPVVADGHPYWRLLPVKGKFFLPTVARVLAHWGPSDCWGFLCISVGSLTYNIKRLEGIVVVIGLWYKWNWIKLNCIDKDACNPSVILQQRTVKNLSSKKFTLNRNPHGLLPFNLARIS